MSYTSRPTKQVTYRYKYRPEGILEHLPSELRQIVWGYIPKTQRLLSKDNKLQADKHIVMKYDRQALTVAVNDNNYVFMRDILKSGDVPNVRWRFEANNIMWATVHPEVVRILLPYMRNVQGYYNNAIIMRRYNVATILIEHPEVDPSIDFTWPEFNADFVKACVQSGKLDIDGASVCSIMMGDSIECVQLVLDTYPINSDRLSIWIQHALKYNRYENVKLLAQYL